MWCWDIFCVPARTTHSMIMLQPEEVWKIIEKGGKECQDLIRRIIQWWIEFCKYSSKKMIQTVQPIFTWILNCIAYLRSTAIYQQMSSTVHHMVSSIHSQAQKGANFVVTNTVAKPICHTVHAIVPLSVWEQLGFTSKEKAVEDLSTHLVTAAQFVSSIVGPKNMYRAAKYAYTFVPHQSQSTEVMRPVEIDEGFQVEKEDMIATGFTCHQKQEPFEKNSIWDPEVQDDLMQLGFDIASEGYLSFCNYLT